MCADINERNKTRFEVTNYFLGGDQKREEVLAQPEEPIGCMDTCSCYCINCNCNRCTDEAMATTQAVSNEALQTTGWNVEYAPEAVDAGHCDCSASCSCVTSCGPTTASFVATLTSNASVAGSEDRAAHWVP